MRPKFLIFLCGVALAFAGCATQKKYPARELTKGQFLEFYSHPGTASDYWEYKGNSAGRHWIYHYKHEQQSFPVVVEIGYIPEGSVPAVLPKFQLPKSETESMAGVKEALK